MQTVPHHFQVLYSELAQRALDADFKSEFDPQGRFISAEVKGKRYWYFDREDENRKKKRTYVGPCDDPEITKRVAAFKELKDDHRDRRKIVSALTNEARLPSPDRLSGDLIAALARAGFFRMRGVLVGTMAFQAYPALLGVLLPGSSMATADIDFAQFHSISVAVEDSMPEMIEVLQSVDQTFRPVPHVSGKAQSTQFISRSKFKIDFLTPNRGSDMLGDGPARTPSLGGASAQPLRFLDYLIHSPKRAVLLHRYGIPINVPAPERYAVHKLIVASRRHKDGDGAAKSRKDLMQAALIMDAMIVQRRQDDLADAFAEAVDRGPSWAGAICSSFLRLRDDQRMRLAEGIVEGLKMIDVHPDPYLKALSEAPAPSHNPVSVEEDRHEDEIEDGLDDGPH